MDYYQGYEDAMRQTRVGRSTGLIGFLFRMILSLVYAAFIYGPLLMLSYVIVQKMSALYSNDTYIKTGLTIVVCYLLFALIYLFKGALIGLRSNKVYAWVVVWLLCVVVTSGVQAIFTQSLLQDFFAERSISNALVWSWLGATAVAIVIYSHYQFLTNISPRSVFWSYQLGFRLVQVGHKEPKKESLPHRSGSFFENAPMRVSFKK